MKTNRDQLSSLDMKGIPALQYHIEEASGGASCVGAPCIVGSVALLVGSAIITSAV